MPGKRDDEHESEPPLRLVPGQQDPESPVGPASEPRDQREAHLLTFLIADVRGYTTFTATRGDEAAAALAARFATVTRGLVAEHSGRLVELRGDEALVVFTSARSAIRAALELRDRFVTETLADPTLPLPVGIGLDAGEAVEVEGGYRGGALNLAARLCSAATPGEVLASREVTHLARHVDGVHYAERGRQQFKGLADPVPVVQVLPAEVDAEREAAFQAAIAPGVHRRPKAKRLVAAGLVLGLLATAGTYGIVRANRPPVLLAGDRVDVLDLVSGEVVEQVALDRQPAGVAAGAGALWVTNAAASTVSRLDLGSRQVRATVDVGGQPSGVVVAGGFVWVSVADRGLVAQISPDVDRVVATIPVGNQPTGIAAGDSGVWVANSADGTVTRINPRTGTASDPVDVGVAPTAVAVTADTVWVTNGGDATVSAVDVGTATLRSNFPVGGGPSGIVAAAGALWVTNNFDGTLTRLDPGSGTVTAMIPVGNGPTAVVAADGKLWVGNEYGAEVVRVDAQTSTVDLTQPVGGTPRGLATADGQLWVTAGASGASHRGGTLRVLGDATGVFYSIDPGINYNSSVMRILYDGLVGVRQASGAAGTALVPNLATAIPSPADGGKTYAFQLRTGIRYSNGVPVRASDLRRGLERSIRVQGSYYYGGIRGARACRKKSGTCDLSDGIQTDDATGAVTFHLRKPDPEFLYKLSLPLASAIPPGTPDHLVDSSPIPTTGPYLIARYVNESQRGLVELVRNPYFREWSRAAKPDGYPDRIVIRTGKDADVALTEVLRGGADLTSGPFPGRLQELTTRYVAQLHLDVSPILRFMALTTTEPPFNDVRVRRALNYAVDRDELVRRWGGSDSFRSSCQVLPPGFPGYSAYCPYVTDLPKAQRLVARSPTHGDRVTIAVPPSRQAVGQYLKQVLTDLGYQVRLDVPPTDEDYYQIFWTPKQPAQLLAAMWTADYPAASQMLRELLGCDTGATPRPFCEEPVQAKIAAALALQQSQSAAASRLWQQVDRAAVDRAALLAEGYSLDATVTSKRVGNYLTQPLYGLMLDQLWVE